MITKNTAVLKCQVPSFVSDYVKVIAWIQDSGMHLYPNTEIGGKYNVMSNGDLYITNVETSDSHPTYRCRTTNILTKYDDEINMMKAYKILSCLLQ